MTSDLPRFGFPIAHWHWSFAWFPIRTYDGRRAWLRWVQRRRIQKYEHLDGGADQWWQYRVLHGYEAPRAL